MNINNTVEKVKEYMHYSLASIKNRYPCKIVKINRPINKNLTTEVVYQAVNKVNIKKLAIEELVSDPMLVEKFHPTDCIRLGFISAGEILLNNSLSLEEVKERFEKIHIEMTKDFI